MVSWYSCSWEPFDRISLAPESDVDLHAELAMNGVLELCLVMPGWP